MIKLLVRCFIICSIPFIAIAETAPVKTSDINSKAKIVDATLDAPSDTATIDEVFSTWSSEAELGYIKTTGNTETESSNFKFYIVNKRIEWEHSLKFETARNSDQTGATAERYYWLFKTRYSLSALSYLFAQLQYEDDRFSGYDYQASEVVGYGWRIVNQDTLKLNAELGVGNRQNKFEDGNSTSESVYLMGINGEWNISKTASLKEDLTVEVGEDSTISKSVTALKTQINSTLSSKISYTVKRASNVPADTEKKDTELAVTLVYSFK